MSNEESTTLKNILSAGKAEFWKKTLILPRFVIL